MPEAATQRMSQVRAQHAANPATPKPASKPGEPSSAKTARSKGNRGGGGGSRGGGSGSRDGGSQRAGSDGESGRSSGKSGDGNSKHLSLPEGISLPGGKEISLPHLSLWKRLALKAVKAVAKHELRKLAKSGAGGGIAGSVLEALENDALQKPQEALKNSKDALKKPQEALMKKPREALEKPRDITFGALRPSLPIQQSVDIAVPLHFAWEKWMELGFLPEGVDQVVDIERSDDQLSGRLDGSSHAEWSAEILDERERESFAWRSNEGSDCAGLVTFHQLSERLTRIELTLDVMPQTPAESASLLIHLADWRARRELRKFKADLELVSPDVYADGAKASSR